MRRDTFLKSLAAMAAAGVLPVSAQSAPALKMMIPANPGGGWDTTGRALGKALMDAKVADTGRPTLLRTQVGAEEIAATKVLLGLNPEESFAAPADVIAHVRKVKERGVARRGGHRSLRSGAYGQALGRQRGRVREARLGGGRRRGTPYATGVATKVRWL